MQDNPYAAVDPAIMRWAHDNNLEVGTNYKDYIVRSVEIDRPARRFQRRLPFQIWIDVPTDEGLVAGHAWDREHQRLDLVSSVEAIGSALNDALSWVRSHI